MVIGSALFAVGTVLFTPPLTDQIAGAATPEAAQVIDVRWFGKVYEIVAAGGIPAEQIPESSLFKGDLLFAVGSVLYSVAAFVSALRAAGDGVEGTAAAPNAALRRRAAVATASLYELGGVSFVVGTLGFVPSGVLGINACPQGSLNMETFGASLFVIGSGLYAMGSAITLGVCSWCTYREEQVAALDEPQPPPLPRDPGSNE